MDCSPFDNMPTWIADHQIGMNLAVTYFYGSRGIKVMPNVRLGNESTFDSLSAYPKGVIIAIGTNGFTKKLDGRDLFMSEVSKVVQALEPKGIVVYGPADHATFLSARFLGIEIRRYDSFMHRRSLSRNKKGGIPR